MNDNGKTLEKINITLKKLTDQDRLDALAFYELVDSEKLEYLNPIIRSFFMNKNPVEAFSIAVYVMSQAFSWLDENNRTEEAKRICMGYLEDKCGVEFNKLSSH